MNQGQKKTISYEFELGCSRTHRLPLFCKTPPTSLSHLQSKVRGFTLMELVVVMTIIVILSTLVLSAAGFVQKKGARDRARAEIAALGAALESYKADNGDYPSNSTTANNTNLIAALMPIYGVTTMNTAFINGAKIYYEFSPKFTNASGFIDPFGYNYNYIYTNGSSNNGANNYDLWSTAGGSTNTNAWIKNW